MPGQYDVGGSVAWFRQLFALTTVDHCMCDVSHASASRMARVSSLHDMHTAAALSMNLTTAAACRIIKAQQGSAVFETVSEEQYSGRVLERITPPRGYNAVSTSGLLAYEVDGNRQQIPFGFDDLQVHLQLGDADPWEAFLGFACLASGALQGCAETKVSLAHLLFSFSACMLIIPVTRLCRYSSGSTCSNSNSVQHSR